LLLQLKVLSGGRLQLLLLQSHVQPLTTAHWPAESLLLSTAHWPTKLLLL
jgi:hypothetical protein